jgi:hypothetical protein
MGIEIDVWAVVVRYARYGEPPQSRQIILGSPANLIRVHVMRSCASALVACTLPVIGGTFLEPMSSCILKHKNKVGHSRHSMEWNGSCATINIQE